MSVTVDRIRRGAESGDGPGEFRGRQYTALALSLTNGSAAAIDLNQVVVTATYGTPARIAAPVYDDDAVDFSGAVPAGGTATATYLFAIPPQGTAKVTVSVDFDGDARRGRFQRSRQLTITARVGQLNDEGVPECSVAA